MLVSLTSLFLSVCVCSIYLHVRVCVRACVSVCFKDYNNSANYRNLKKVPSKSVLKLYNGALAYFIYSPRQYTRHLVCLIAILGLCMFFDPLASQNS